MPLRPPRSPLPPLNALRAFEAAARTGSFLKAAQELNVTPGAVTQQIRKLEALLGAPLFERRPQGVVATPEALAALPAFNRAFDTLAQACEQLRRAERRLAIVALPCIAQLWLSPRLPALRAALPGVDISVSAEEEPPRGRGRRHDLARFFEDADLPAENALPPDTITPVCTPALAARLHGTADLAAVTLLHDAVWRRDWQHWLEAAGAPPGVNARRGPSFSLYSLALDAALGGSGVLMGRESLLRPWFADGRLVTPFPLRVPTGDRLTLRFDDEAPPAAHTAATLLAKS